MLRRLEKSRRSFNLRLRDFLEVLQKQAFELIPNGEAKCSYAELFRFKEIVESFGECQGKYEMNKAPDIKREIIELQEKVDRIFTLNQFQTKLNQLKNDIKIPEQQILASGNIQLVQEKLLKIMANGINLNEFPKLNEYTKEQILGWTRFLNDYNIDLTVCGIDDICFLMKNFLYKKGNMKRTKKQIDVFKDVIRRSDMNQFRR